MRLQVGGKSYLRSNLSLLTTSLSAVGGLWDCRTSTDVSCFIGVAYGELHVYGDRSILGEFVGTAAPYDNIIIIHSVTVLWYIKGILLQDS